MSVLALYIINRHGSLLYQLDVASSNVSSNDKIRIASIFHSVSAIAAKLSPNKLQSGSELSFLNPAGIDFVAASNLAIYSKETLTGLKLVAVVHPTFPAKAARDILAIVYANYSDFVLKDPFYCTDMPIRCSLFDKAVRQVLQVPS